MVTLASVQGKRWDLIWEIIGILYLVISMTLSIYCLDIFAPYLQNDFFWPGFEEMNTSRIITSIFNTQLTLAANGTIDLFSPATSILTKASNLQINPAYPRMVFYQDLTTIKAGIDQLRRIDISYLAVMESPYCWLDMNRRWEMAHTLLRQSRCEKLYQQNAAVHLEVVLRNTDFFGWLVLNSVRFNDRIGAPIQKVPGGLLWLTQLKQHTLLDAEDEAGVWVSHSFAYFSLQFSNLANPGIEETIAIENAMGIVKLYRIKSTPRIASTIWTSLSIYCPIECDFVGLPVNQSFIRNTTNFWADINQNALEAFAVGYPLTLTDQVVHNEIGPLMSIDVRWVPSPPSLVRAVQSFRSQVLTLLSTDTIVHETFAALQTLELTPTPILWKNIVSYGGNPMCHKGAPLPFVQKSFSFDDACGSQTPLTLIANPMNALFSAVVLGQDLAHACLLCLPSEQIDCIYQADTVARLSTHISSLDISDIAALDISYIQFVESTTQLTNISLSTHHLLESNWAYFGYMSIYDWAMNEKEVISFEGDISTIRLMSSGYALVNSKVTALESTLAVYLWYLTALLTLVLVAVAAILSLWWLLNFSTKCQWFNFNRLVGCVWLNRTVLLVRSAAAIFCLATVPLQPTTKGVILPLAHDNRSWFVLGLLAGETIWLTYICQELIQPFAFSMSSRYIHLISFIVWLIIWGFSVYFPVEPVATFNRDCYSVNMDTMIYCSSGYLQIGFCSRVVLIVVINITIVLVLTSILRSHSSHKYYANDSLLITAAAVSCISSQTLSQPNPIISAMCGIINVTFRGVEYTFDTKLWLQISNNPRVPGRVMPFVSNLTPTPPFNRQNFARYITSKKIWQNCKVAIGFAYLALTLIGNITYLDIVQENLGNDFFWAGFDSSGMHAFIANLFNRKLIITANQDIHLDNSSLGDLADLYNNAESSISWGANSARRQLFAANTSLYNIVQGLRAMQPSQLPWMFTQYCWLDFNQTWEMATTSNRQVRCLQASNNGALYLESGLRNIMDWDEWEHSWGTTFNISFRVDLETSISGRAWLSNIYIAQELSIEEEILYWRNHDITTFELQWQNYKTLGMSDSVLIKNALGLRYPLQISLMEGSIHTQQQTSFRLYWTLANDLWAVTSNCSSICGKSLIRGSSRFAFANRTSESLLFENYILTSPLRSGLISFRNVIGPFNSVDTKYVQCPSSLLQFFGDFTSAFTTLLLSKDAIQTAFLNQSVPSLTYYAPKLLSQDPTAFVVGGSIMCGDDNAAYPASVIIFHDTLCFNPISEQLSLTRMEMVFALMAFNWTHSKGYSDFAEICTLNKAAAISCSTSYRGFYSFMQNFTSPLNYLQPLSNKAYIDVKNLVVELTQYVIYNGSSAQLFHMNIFNQSDQSWGFCGWCL
ncbi:hypothetical protein THRCLA_21026, partial [Thraustotheca clavata]